MSKVEENTPSPVNTLDAEKDQDKSGLTLRVHPTVRAQAVTLRTYQRHGETWEDTCLRVKKHLIWQYKKGTGRSLTKTQLKEIDDVMDLIYNRKICCAGRTLWLGGTELVMKKNRESSQFNCSFINISTPNDIKQALHLLLQGCGVGFKMCNTVMNGFKSKMESIEVIRSSRKDKGAEKTSEYFDNHSGSWRIEVGDSADAWSVALEKLLRCDLPSGFRVKKLVLDFSQIRPPGTRLNDYGWISMGDSKIAEVYNTIAHILNNRVEQILSKIDILDIMNHIGTMLSTRRSAEIALMDYGDKEWREFAQAKKDFWLKNNFHRQQSNNSLVFNKKPTRAELQEIFDLMVASGGSEPGFINMEEAQRRAPWCSGTNPCGEILLANKSFCCLTEINLPAFKGDITGLHQAIKLTARMNYRQTIVKLQDGTLDEAWDDTMSFLRLCGVGLTGITAWEDLSEYELKRMKTFAVSGAFEMAEELGLAKPKNVTCIKPSGCLAVDTLLQTNHGLLRLDEIGDVNGSQWQDISDKNMQVAQESDYHPVSKFFVNNHNMIKKIQFSSGLTLRCTPHHQLRVFDSNTNSYEWKRADELQINNQLPFRLDTFAPVDQMDVYEIVNALGCQELIIQDSDEEEIFNKKVNLAAIFNSLILNLMGAFKHAIAYKKKELHEFHIYSTFDANEIGLAKGLLEKYFVNTVCVEEFVPVVAATKKTEETTTTTDEEASASTKPRPIIKIIGKGIFDFLEAATATTASASASAATAYFPVHVRSSNRNNIIAFLYGAQGIGFLKNIEQNVYIYKFDETITLHTTKEHWANEIVVVLRALGYSFNITSDANLIKFVLTVKTSDNSNSGKISTANATLVEIFVDGKFDLDSVVSITDGDCETFDIEVPENHCYVANGMISHNTLSKHFGTEETGEIPEGIHKPLGKYIFNNIGYSIYDPIVPILKEAGYRVFDKPHDASGVLITYPVKYNDGIGFTNTLVKRKDGREEMVEINLESAIDQLNRYKKININWTEHNSSATISYDVNEVPAIVDWFMENWDFYVGVSFMFRNDPSKNAEDLGYPYLPQEVVTKSDYDAYVAKLKPVDFDEIARKMKNSEIDLKPIEDENCLNGGCGVR